jgi:antitoxin CptB
VRVRGEDASGSAARSAFADLERGELNDYRSPEQGGRSGGRLHPLNRTARQMVEQVDHSRKIEPFEKLRELRPDAFQRLHFGKKRIEDFRAHARLLAQVWPLAMKAEPDYMNDMPSDPELKRLAWRAHHRGTKEADLLIGGFFDAHHQQWGVRERAQFAAMLEEQDVDIMAWAHGTAEPSARFEGPMMEALRRLNYVRIAR